MLNYIISQMKRKPLPAVAVLLFAAILTMVLCGLQAASEQEQRNYEELYRTVPVTVTVTDITGTNSDIEGFPFVYNVFTSDYEMGAYLKDFKFRMSRNIYQMEINGEAVNCAAVARGINTLGADSLLSQSTDSVITWFEGFDESVLQTDEMVCILPSSLMSEEDSVTVKLVFSQIMNIDGEFVTKYDTRTLSVVGVHDADSSIVYCPLKLMKSIYSRLDATSLYDYASATISDNYKIDEMWEEAADWFVEPDPTGKQTPWDYSWFYYYPYALKVDDSQLVAAEAALENSMKLNRICMVVVLALSVAVSFLIGFLMIRSRKREIALMRTMGTPNRSIYAGFAFEQILCVALGTLLGGSYFLWQPVERLAVFVGIYFVGLSIALLIFLHTNLISTIKEDE